jgi:sugar lactone lactonase YvrE
MNSCRSILISGIVLLFLAGNRGTALAASNKPEPSDAGRAATDVELERPTSLAISPADALYVATLAGAIYRVDLKTGLLTTLHRKEPILSVGRLLIDRNGNLIVADYGSCRVHVINLPDESVQTIAGSGMADNGGCKSSGDGGPASKASFRPDFIALDKDRSLLITDAENRRIRRVDIRSGLITTVAGSDKPDSSGDGGPATEAGLENPTSVAVNGKGDLFISQAGGGAKSHPIRQVDAQTGLITTLTGSAFNERKPLWSELTGPRLLFADPLGNLYVLDQSRVHYLDFSHKLISTIVGSSKKGFAGDGGPADKAQLNYPYALAFDSQGNLYVADSFNNRVRRVDAKTKIITTVAGNGLPRQHGSNVKIDLSLKAVRSSTAVQRFGR